MEVTYDNFTSFFKKSVIAAEKVLNEVHNTQELVDWYHREFPHE